MRKFDSFRLYFSPVDETYREPVARLYQNIEVMRYIAPVFTPDKADSVVSAMIKQNSTSKAQYFWVVNQKSDNTFAGVMMLHKQSLSECGSAEIGIIISPELSNQGLAEEAFTALVEYAGSELKVRTFYTYFQQEHGSVRKMLEKVGFIFQEKIHSQYRTTMVGVLSIP